MGNGLVCVSRPLVTVITAIRGYDQNWGGISFHGYFWTRVPQKNSQNETAANRSFCRHVFVLLRSKIVTIDWLQSIGFHGCPLMEIQTTWRHLSAGNFGEKRTSSRMTITKIRCSIPRGRKVEKKFLSLFFNFVHVEKNYLLCIQELK